jgi:hypothetical protein
MERAGAPRPDAALHLAGDRGRPIVVLAGPGNNGGDALVAARVLRGHFQRRARRVHRRRAALPPMRRGASRFVEAGGTTTVEPPAVGRPWSSTAPRHRPLAPARRRNADLVLWANASGAPILALDVPSGLDAATGQAHAPAIRASSTSTFIALKPGLAHGRRSGLLRRHRRAFARLAIEDEARGHRLDGTRSPRSLPSVLARRTRNVNKGRSERSASSAARRHGRRADPRRARARCASAPARCGSDS